MSKKPDTWVLFSYDDPDNAAVLEAGEVGSVWPSRRLLRTLRRDWPRGAALYGYSESPTETVGGVPLMEREQLGAIL